jgi:hypothetical protein
MPTPFLWEENREISWTSRSKGRDRSAKAINRTADMNVQEKSDCAVVPVNRRTTKGNLPRRSGREGRGLRRTSLNLARARHRAGNACPRDCAVCGSSIFILMLLRRYSSKVRAVCVNALVRICPGALSNQRPYRGSCDSWSSAARRVGQVGR